MEIDMNSNSESKITRGKTKSKTPYFNHDGSLKHWFTEHLRDFLEFAFPKVADDINWEHEIRYLNVEHIQNIYLKGSEKSLCDFVALVQKKNGKAIYLGLHIEQQTVFKKDMFERFAKYHMALRLYHNISITSLVVLTDLTRKSITTFFRDDFIGNEGYIEISFPLLNLADLIDKFEELETSPKLSAHALKSYISIMQKARPKTVQERLDLKKHEVMALVRALYKAGFSKDNIVKALTFLDMLIILPPKVEELFQKQHKAQLEGDLNMHLYQKYEQAAEKKGLSQGISQGLIQGECKLFTSLLETKFGKIPTSFLAKIKQANEETLLKWSRKILFSDSIDEVFAA